jgi:hypothetical protein
MAGEQEALRDWHRLFGLLLTDLFSGSPFAVEVERNLSVQQQLLDTAIVRRGPGRFPGRLPDGLAGLRPHNDDRQGALGCPTMAAWPARRRNQSGPPRLGADDRSPCD